MTLNAQPNPRSPGLDHFWWQLALVVFVSVAFEALFVRVGANIMDEGWPLYAAMQLQAGGTLYRDVFWVFPPASLLPAMLGNAVDPPGLLVARYIYIAFTVSLCGAIYVLARHLMPPTYALLAGLLVAIAAPHSHLYGVVFGYRYLVFTVLALLCFSYRVRTGRLGWTVAAGALTGVALLFRLTPAFAVSVGIGIGILLLDEPWRIRLREALAFAAALLAVVAIPILVLGTAAGFEALWMEIVVRPVEMTRLQSLPVPPPRLPEGPGRWQIADAYADNEFWLYPALFLGYAIWLGKRGVSCWRDGKSFDHLLLTAVVLWGGIFLLRSFGRADIFHLESAVPPVCLLLAHLTYVTSRFGSSGVGSHALRVAFVLGLWTVFKATDMYTDPQVRGQTPLAAFNGRVVATPVFEGLIDEPVEAILRLSEPGDLILDLSASPVYHPLTGRFGPGGADLIMPGTFLDEAEEQALLNRLESRPPALVLIPRRIFDGRPERGPQRVAPRVFRWVQDRYVLAERLEFIEVLVRAPAP